MARTLNPFSFRKVPLPSVASDIVPITPSDDDDLQRAAMAIYVEGAGNISVITNSGQTRTFGVTAFSLIPLAVTRILSTNTTATGIHALVRN